MRRKDRELTARVDFEAILRGADACRIAINTGDFPYIVAMNYGYSWENGLEIYFHCAGEGRKIDLLKLDDRVGFEIDTGHELVTADRACAWGMKYSSVVGTGRVEIVRERGRKVLYLDRILRHYGYTGLAEFDGPEVEKIAILRLQVLEMAGKARV